MSQNLELNMMELEILKTVVNTDNVNVGHSIKQLRDIKALRMKVNAVGPVKPLDPQMPAQSATPTPEEIAAITKAREDWSVAMKTYWETKVPVQFTPEEASLAKHKLASFDQFQSADRVADAVISLGEKLGV